MGDNKWLVFHSPKQDGLTHLHRMCLIACGLEVHRQKICQDVHLPRIGCRLEVHRDVCLPLIGTDGKCNDLWVFLLKLLQTVILGQISGTWVWTQPEPIYLANI